MLKYFSQLSDASILSRRLENTLRKDLSENDITAQTILKERYPADYIDKLYDDRKMP